MVDFLIIGPRGAIVYKDMFKFIKDRKIVFGYNSVSDFDNNNKSVVCRWFQNMVDYHPELILSRRYSDGEYKKYDNAEFINIDRTRDIPNDYYGVMGVPFSYIDYWDSGQFELIGMFCDARGCDYLYNGEGTYIDEGHKRYTGPVVDGKALINRILIRKK